MFVPSNSHKAVHPLVCCQAISWCVAPPKSPMPTMRQPAEAGAVFKRTCWTALVVSMAHLAVTPSLRCHQRVHWPGAETLVPPELTWLTVIVKVREKLLLVGCPSLTV